MTSLIARSRSPRVSKADRAIDEEYAVLAKTLEVKQPANDGSFHDFGEFMKFYISTSSEDSRLKEFLKEDWVNPVRNDYLIPKGPKKKLTRR